MRASLFFGRAEAGFCMFLMDVSTAELYDEILINFVEPSTNAHKLKTLS